MEVMHTTATEIMLPSRSTTIDGRPVFLMSLRTTRWPVCPPIAPSEPNQSKYCHGSLRGRERGLEHAFGKEGGRVLEATRRHLLAHREVLGGAREAGEEEHEPRRRRRHLRLRRGLRGHPTTRFTGGATEALRGKRCAGATQLPTSPAAGAQGR